jgi:hypothetical protein
VAGEEEEEGREREIWARGIAGWNVGPACRGAWAGRRRVRRDGGARGKAYSGGVAPLTRGRFRGGHPLPCF